MKKVLKFFFKLVFSLLFLSVLQVVVLKWVPVRCTPLMVKRSIEYRSDKDFKTRKKWVPYEEISAELSKAVIASEDNLFGVHKGFDWKAIESELERHQKTGKRLRGRSTISQQTAKNVFTFGDRSYFRKAVEVYYTFLIEKIWGKKRILEVYLNVIETGKGVYGAEATAQHFFGKPASKLSRADAALIAAVLPSPLQRNLAKPSSYMLRRRSQIQNLIPKLDYSFL